MSLQDTRRFFGPLNAPADDTNARHRAFLRKVLELYTQKQLQEDLIRTNKLRLAMGLGLNATQFGKILTSFVRNGRVVMRETDPPDPASQTVLQKFRAAFDLCFYKRGKDLVIRNPDALPAVQAADQAWHDYIVPYRAARGMGPRPEWALQPLPGIERVQEWVRAPAPTRRRHRFPLPTPPPTSPTRGGTPVPIGPRLPILFPVGSRLRPIDLTGDIVQRSVPKLASKRRRSRSIEMEERPRKKAKIKFLGFVDLTEK
ncbi:hypothetical protein GGX14DRAFT_571196 [Mycena pura]|uniref:Uncharacterized protein n=1 Tax=Mycena pura TaxID=153505 RepID=A0AAD6VAF9_9AGAR|nr:hypothetical protein GGX14DRAFT_571196 [Mycena pura]